MGFENFKGEGKEEGKWQWKKEMFFLRSLGARRE